VAYAALYGLHCDGKLDRKRLLAAREHLGIDPERECPLRA